MHTRVPGGMGCQNTDIPLLSCLINLVFLLLLQIFIANHILTTVEQRYNNSWEKLGAIIDYLESEENHQVPILNGASF